MVDDIDIQIKKRAASALNSMVSDSFISKNQCTQALAALIYETPQATSTTKELPKGLRLELLFYAASSHHTALDSSAMSARLLRL
ncbi:MAG: hypothetical protein RR584_13090, partial [Comamonas sp.]